jgi:hypothetical protein
MNRPLPDPTLARPAPDSSPDSSIVTDDGDMLGKTGNSIILLNILTV